MNRSVKEQLREYFDYFESSLESDLSADRLAVPPRRLEQPPRHRGPGWAVAVGVAVAALAVVALAVVVVNALDRSPADTTIAPAVTITTTPVETTIPDESGPIMRDAGPAEQIGWTWMDNGDVGFKDNFDGEIIGMVDSGVVLLKGRAPGQGCDACVLQLWAFDGSVQSHQLEFLEGLTIEQTGVGANLIWVLHGSDGVGEIGGVVDPDRNMWVSADGDEWTQVEVIDPDGILRPFERVFDDLWSVRFLRRGDQVLAINMSNGHTSLSNDEGRTFEVIDHNAEIRSRGTDLIRRAWATDDSFFVVYGRSPQLWHSPDGVAWELRGNVQGGPQWSEPQVPVASSPEPLVLPLPDGRLLTTDPVNDNTAFVSEDNGLSWEPIPGPYPYEGGGLGDVVNQGWIHVWAPAEQRVWVSADGYDWYSLPGRTASSGDPASGVFIDGTRIAIPPQAP